MQGDKEKHHFLCGFVAIVAESKNFTPEQIIDALNRNRGLVFLAARDLGCHANTIRNYRLKHPEIHAVYKEHKGVQVDTAVSKLMEAVDAGEGWAITLTLKTLGKDRGYVERQEHTGKDGKELHASPAKNAEAIAGLIHTDAGRAAVAALSAALVAGGPGDAGQQPSLEAGPASGPAEPGTAGTGSGDD